MKNVFLSSICSFVILIILSIQLHAATYTVTNTGDNGGIDPAPFSGTGTLRQAIVDANNNPGVDVIQFNILPGGLQTIQPLSQLPPLSDPAGVLIDGFTQPGGAAPGANPPSTATLLIEIDGILCMPAPPHNTAHGFIIDRPNNTIQGLVINNFQESGVFIRVHPSGNFNNLIYCNFIGTDPGGTINRGNGTGGGLSNGGVYIGNLGIGTAYNNTVDRNLISCNYAEGVGIVSCPPDVDVYQNQVTKNYIGTDITGGSGLGNVNTGVYIGEAAHHNVVDGNLIADNGFEGVSIVGYAEMGWNSHHNTVSNNIVGLNVNLSPLGNGTDGVCIGIYRGTNYFGGFARDNTIGPGNIISQNQRNGVVVWEHNSLAGNADGNQITQNSIYSNNLLGIDLGDNGVTNNDPGDLDTGPNQELNFPIISGATYNMGSGQTNITGTLNIDTNPTLASVEIFIASPDPSGYGEGKTFIVNVTPNATGNWNALVTGVGPNSSITATTTDQNKNTSEFSANFLVPLTSGLDFGDAPDPTYPTLLANNGARHQIVAGYHLGNKATSIDPETDGQPSANAMGDDNFGNDDEDGITITALPPGSQGIINISWPWGVTGFLDGWIDFNGDGSWAQPGDRIFNSQPLGPLGFATFFVNVPSSATPNINTMARFRFSSSGGLSYTGLATDGEVEDYQVYISGNSLDFGDAPDPTYPTLSANNGASHILDGVTWMGSIVDPEPDGQPDPNALGDDMDILYPPPLDDEDGVFFKSPLVLGSIVSITVVASNSGFLNAWIDFDNNGTWINPGEQIFSNVFLNPGNNNLSFMVPNNAITGITFARFRFSTMQGLTFTGQAPDGEVEDYAVLILVEYPDDLEYGDAPEGSLAYPSTGVFGAFPTCRNVMISGWIQHHNFGARFGPQFDMEPEGNAGNCPCFAPNQYNMDECFNDGDAGLLVPDGFTIIGPAGSETVIPCTGAVGIPLGNPCQTAIWGVNIDMDIHNNMPNNSTGYMNVLFDWDQNGQWGGSSNCTGTPAPEHILVNFPIPNGFNGPLSLLMPQGLGFLIGPNNGYVWARFSITDAMVPNNWDGSGAFEDGETEDYLILVGTAGLDWGDAPDAPYPTLLASNGARHQIVPNIFLGTAIDGETDGQPHPQAMGDDNNGVPNDEDGVIFTSAISPGSSASVQVTASTSGKLNAWIDFDNNGSWANQGEQIFTNVNLNAGTNILTFAVPAGAQVGNTMSRFRFDTNGGLSFTGYAPDGEVEDYMVTIVQMNGVQIDPDPNGQFTQNEISMDWAQPIAQNPAIILAAYNDHPFAGGPGLGVSYSTDDGATWTSLQLPYPPDPYSGGNFIDAFDPSVTIDGNGDLYVAHISTDNNWTVGPASGLYVHKSTNRGVSWLPPVAVATNGPPPANPALYRFNDRCQIIADINPASQHYNNIYIVEIKDRGWNQLLPYSDIYFSRSTNGGATWSQQVILNNNGNMGNMPIPAVASDGTIYVCWIDYNVLTGGVGTLYMDSSNDGGVSWLTTDIIVRTINLPPLNLNGNTDAKAKGAAVIDVSPTNPQNVYITYAERMVGTTDEADIFFIQSTNGGVSWSAPLRVNDDATQNDQVMPWMDVKPNGTIDIAWYDRRNDPNDSKWDVYMAMSTDGGNSFMPNVKVNSVPSAITPLNQNGPWMGEYLGLTVSNTKAYVAYASSITDIKGDIYFDKVMNPGNNHDFGDAPDAPYPTLLASNGARHNIVPGVFLGAAIDNEPDGQPELQALGDDNNGIPDDEDGVVFSSAISPASTATVQVTASTSGKLNAWIDFNNNGSWANQGEQIFTDVSLNAGTNTLTFNIPAGAQVGSTMSRFRFDTNGGLSYTGYAPDGEVEDYQIVITMPDFGDAPEGALAYPSTGIMGQFPTCTGTGPAGWIQHGTGSALFGPGGESEPDGNGGLCPVFNPNAYDSDETFQDNDAGLLMPLAYTITGNPGSEKVVPLSLLPQYSLGNTCTLAQWGTNMDINLTNYVINNGIAYLNVLIDWDQNGAWGGSSTCSGGQPVPEHVLVNFQIPNSYQGLLSQLAPPGFMVGPNGGFVWVRFTITDQPVPIPWDGSGNFYDGETEDYLLLVGQIDFGDAPDTPYPTVMFNDGACHQIDYITYMGTAIDGEPDGQPHAQALGDDNNGIPNDEDGVAFITGLTQGSATTVQVTASTIGKLNAWIDFNMDGDWADQGEQIFTNVSLSAGINTLTFNVPAGAQSGNAMSRFRFNTNGGLSYTGYASDGEVEDYMVTITAMGASWSDGFEGYPLNTCIVGQGGWQAWGGAPTAPYALVTNTQVCTGTKALSVRGAASKDGADPMELKKAGGYSGNGKENGQADDVLHMFNGCTSGVWLLETWQYIPSEASGGTTYMVVLNQYDEADTTTNWSTQVCFDPDQHTVTSDFDGGTVPLVKGSWVKMQHFIDLENNLQSFYYNNQHLVTKSWTEGISGSGILNIAALNLYAHTLENVDVYYDDISLQQVDGQSIHIFDGWNGISSFIYPVLDSVEAIMGPVSDELVVMYNLDDVYWPEQFSTLHMWDTTTGYKIKVNGDVLLNLYGAELQGNTVYLSTGWNLIPVYGQVDAMAVLGSLPGFEIAYNVPATKVLWPKYNIQSLFTLYPGKAYMVYMTQPGSITFPAGSTKSSHIGTTAQDVSTPWNDVHLSPNTHIVAVMPGAMEFCRSGDHLGAFTSDGRCAGAIRIADPQKTQVMCIMGDDPSTAEKDGFVAEEQIMFKWYRSDTDQTIDIEVSHNDDLDAVDGFKVNGISMIQNMIDSLAGLNEIHGKHIEVFPNPATDKIRVTGISEPATIRVFTITGEQVYQSNNTLPCTIDLGDQPTGFYMLNVETSYGLYNVKLILQ